MDKAGHRHARLGTTSEHLFNRIEDVVINAFAKRHVQGRGGFGKTYRNHDEAFQKKSWNGRRLSFSNADSKGRVQQWARPLTGQGGGNLLLADESEHSEPLPDSAVAGDALRFERGSQLLFGDLVPGEQKKTKGKAVRRRCRLRARQEPLKGVIERSLQARLGTVSSTTQHDSRSLWAKAAPRSASASAVASAAARRELFPKVPAITVQLIEVKV